MYWQFLKAVLLFHWSRAPFYCLKIEKSSWNHFFVWLRALFVKKSPFVKKNTWTAIFRAAASFTRYLDQNHSWFLSKAANRTLKFIKHKHENTGAGHIFKSACWHLNRRISTGPCRMKTIKWSYIMESSRLFIFRSQIIFWRSSSTSTVYFNVNNVMMTSFHQSPSWSWRRTPKIFLRPANHIYSS